MKVIIQEFKSKDEINDIVKCCEMNGNHCVGFPSHMGKKLVKHDYKLRVDLPESRYMDKCDGKLYREQPYEYHTWCHKWFKDSYKVDPISEELWKI